MNEKEAAGLFASMGGKARARKLSKKRRMLFCIVQLSGTLLKC
jgi:hypothetical protein